MLPLSTGGAATATGRAGYRSYKLTAKSISMRNLIIEFSDEVEPQPDTTYTVLVKEPLGKAYFVMAEYWPATGFFSLFSMQYIPFVVAWGRHPSDEALQEWLRVNNAKP